MSLGVRVCVSTEPRQHAAGNGGEGNALSSFNISAENCYTNMRSKSNIFIFIHHRSSRKSNNNK